MYGMIHRGVREMVISDFGEAAWDEAASSIGVDLEHLVSMATYSDDITIAILQRVSILYGISFDQLIRKFGQFWIVFVQRNAYGAMMDFVGSDLVTFINNLNRMHQAVQSAMPDADLPIFRLVSDQPMEMIVEYTSSRFGLEAFVVGLLEGLLKRFDQGGAVNYTTSNGGPIIFTITKF